MKEKSFKLIKLTQGKFAMVDPDLFDYLNQWNWIFSSTGYAQRHVIFPNKKIRRAVLMHNIILDNHSPSPTNFVDHINGIRLDNRRINLRICTQTQNAQNYPGWSNKKSSIYKGVFKRENGKFRVIIQANGQRYHIGQYNTEIEAAKVYNDNAILLHGEFANLNKIEA